MAGFFDAVVAWQRTQGRHHLPWQGTTDPYRVWLSEIMLQQTQVATVCDYYGRFLARFPDVQALARASEDEVLALWSGLGYYSRARHLHRCARAVVEGLGGRFPTRAAELQQLPGIGPSTAAAIAAFCFGERISILDGNVQRVLTRWWAIEGDMAATPQVRALWQRAQSLVPNGATPAEMAAYTQGLMDLGATVCRRTQPDCAHCPVAATCQAHRQGRPTAFPVKTRRLQRRTESWWCLVWWRASDGAYWLQPRPRTGIWAGLYAFPVYDTPEAVQAALPPQAQPEWHPSVRHDLTHRALWLHPVSCEHPQPDRLQGGVWVSRASDLHMGLPAPLRVWLASRCPD
jgi:A/G-specific adenine glycosylase